MGARGFGSSVISQLQVLEPRAVTLQLDAKKDSVAIGFDIEGQFLPLFGLAAPTPKYSKMTLFIWDNGDWKPTFYNGTYNMIAERLIPILEPLWSLSDESL